MKNKYSLWHLLLPILLWSASSEHALPEPISLNQSSSFDCSPVVTAPPVTRGKCQDYVVDRQFVLSGPARIRVTACPIETPDPEDKTYVIYTSSPNWLTWLCQDNNKGRESSQQTEVEALTITIVDKQTSDPDGEIPAVAGGGHDDDLFDDRRPRKPGMPPGIIPVLLETVSAGWLPVRLMSFAFDLELPGLSDNSPIFFQQGIQSDDSDILVVASGNRQKIYRRVYQLGSWYLAGQTDSNALPPIEEPFDDFIAEDQSVRILVGVFGWAGKDSIPIYQMPVGQGQDNGASGIGQSVGGSEMSGSTSTGARDMTSYPQQGQGNGDGDRKRNSPPNEKEPVEVNVGYYECPICLEEIQDAVQLSCGHSFCNQCIQELKRHQETPQCPECKEIISGEGTPNYALRRLERNRLPNKRACKKCRVHIVSSQKPTPTNPVAIPEETRSAVLSDSTVPSTFHAVPRQASTVQLRFNEDFFDVKMIFAQFDPVSLSILAEYLGVSRRRVEGEADDVTRRWLMQSDEVGLVGNPSWELLANGCETIGRNDLALAIRAEHPEGGRAREVEPVTASNRELTTNDFFEVTAAVRELDPENIKNLAGALGLYPESCTKHLENIVQAWLIGKDGVIYKGKRSWNRLAHAMDRIGQTDQARLIRQQHPAESVPAQPDLSRRTQVCPHPGCTWTYISKVALGRHRDSHHKVQRVCSHPGCTRIYQSVTALKYHEDSHKRN